VLGDVTAFGGSIIVEDQGKINGDATAFGGDIRLDKQVSVAGDVAVFGGHLRRDPAATIGGDATNFAGAGWMLLIFLLPIVVLGAFIAFVVWLIRRIMRPSVPATA
jgi:cytoskeletal protein CcmA (bactofilin family)